MLPQLFALFSALIVCTSTSAFAQVTGTWSFCGVVQDGNFYSITSGIFSSSTSTALTYNGNSQSYLANNGTGSMIGNRVFYSTTQGSTPVLMQNATIVQLDPPGSTGGNSNYFFPTSPVELDGDGVTIRFNQIPLIDGQSSNASTGATVSMNFWFTNGEYDEENKGGTHELPAWSSSLAIVPVPLGTTALPTCAPATTVQWYFCFALASSSYTVVFSGFMNTTGIAQPYAASSSNQLTQTQQGVFVVAASGSRVYTPLNTGISSTQNVVSVLAPGSFIGNGNYLYPAGPRVTDWNGIAFQMDSVVPINGETSTSNKTILWYQQSVSAYIEETSSGSYESTPTYSSFIVQPVSQYTSISSQGFQCQLPPNTAATTIYYTFCSQLVGTNFTSIMSGTLTLQNIPFSKNNATYYLVTGASGQRVFTNRVTGVSTTSIITGIIPGGVGGPDMWLFINGVNASLPAGQSPVLDGDGITFTFDSQPPIYGEPVGTLNPPQMNWWFESSVQTYLEEVAGGTHEVTPTLSAVTVQAASFGAAVPVCAVPSSSSTLGAGLSQYTLCSSIEGPTYTSVVSALLTVNSTASSTGGYSVVAAVGSRTYSNLTSNPYVQQFDYITSLSPLGSVGGPDNIIYPNAGPLQRLSGDGLTFNFSAIPAIDGQVGLTQSVNQMNLWFNSGTNSYLEENAGGKHETSPVASQLTITPFSGGALGVTPQCSLPATIPVSFCFVMAAPTYTTVLNGLMNLTSFTQLIVASSNNNQLVHNAYAYTVVSATGRRVFTNLTSGTVSTANIVSLAPGFVGATQYVYLNQNLSATATGINPTTDWNGIAANFDAPLPISGEPNGGSTLVWWYQSAIGQYLEETASSSHETSPTYSSLTFQPYYGVAPTCSVPTGSQSYYYFSFCMLLTGPQYTSSVSGVLQVSPTVILVGGSQAYFVINANGTRVYTDLTTGQTQTTHIVDLASLAVSPLGGPDNYLFYSSPILLDGDGLTFEFDVEPIIYGQPLGTNPSKQMNVWFNGPTYLEETASGTHEVSPTNSSFTIAPFSATSALPACSASPAASSSSSSSVVRAASSSATASFSSSSSSSGAGNPGGPDTSSSSSSLSNGQIAGIVIGVVVGVLLLCILCVLLLCTSFFAGAGKGSKKVPDEPSSRRIDGDVEMQGEVSSRY